MNSRRSSALMVIGQPVGMERVVTHALQSAELVRQFPDIETALASDFLAEIVLVLQHWSDEYSRSEIRQLLEGLPGARFIVALGPWCVSDRRTRQTWPAAMCVHESDVERRLERELAVLDGRLSPLPWTAGMDEIFSFDNGTAVEKPS